MPDLTSAEPLVGDPARQAPDLHRGIVFQIWRSVEAWINLKEDELLYLEGAEDFDIVANGSAAAVQTKATSGNITLRTAAVLDAMVNYWLVRSNNPTKRVCFRYITTSAIGAEQGNPFGDRQSGLKIWQECAATRDLTQVAKLKTFLATDIVTAPCLNTKNTDKLVAPEPNLLTFLKTASVEDVLNELIAPMSWELESVDEDVVRESIGLL